MNPAEHPGICHRLVVGPNDPAGHGDTRAKRDMYVLAGAGGFRVIRQQRVDVGAPTSRLTSQQRPLVELLKNVIIARRL